MIKAKGFITRMLKTPNQFNDFVSHLFPDGLFDKKAEDISETSSMWNVILSRGDGYDVLINVEIKSSVTSLNTPRNISAVLFLIVIALEIACARASGPSRYCVQTRTG